MPNEHAGHRARMRKQFLTNGLSGFHEHQILELLLFYAIPQKDTNILAHQLINRFGGLAKVFDASPEELTSVPGVGMNTAVFLKAVSGIYSEYGRPDGSARIIIDNVFAADAYFSSVFRSSNGEQFGITVLDDDLSVLYTEKYQISTPKFDPDAAAKLVSDRLLTGRSRRCILSRYRPDGMWYLDDEGSSAEKLTNQLRAIGISIEQYFLISLENVSALIFRR